MNPKQLRDLADAIEKGNADATYHIQVDTEDRAQEIGVDYMGTRMLGKRYVQSKVVIEVRCWTDVSIQNPVTGEWMSLSSSS